MTQRRDDALPFSAGALIVLAVLALGLMVGAVLWAFATANRVQDTIQTQQLEDAFRSVPPPSASQLLFSGESRLDACGGALIFHIYRTRETVDAVQTHYDRQFQQRGWVQDPRTHQTYLAETMRVQLVEPVPSRLGEVAIPQRVFAAQSPNTTVYAAVVTGWRGDLCPQWNRSAQVRTD